jgi:hypothetical protein
LASSPSTLPPRRLSHQLKELHDRHIYQGIQWLARESM